MGLNTLDELAKAYCIKLAGPWSLAVECIVLVASSLLYMRVLHQSSFRGKAVQIKEKRIREDIE